MDPIEKAIRAALEKGDASDPKHRERVYLSALSALERSLKSGPDIPAETAARRRDALRQRIRAIETEFRPAIEPEPEPVPEPEAGPPVEPAVPPVREPGAGVHAAAPPVGIDTPQGTARETDFVSQLRVDRRDDGLESAPGDDPGSVERRPRRRRPFARLLTVSLLLVFVGIGAWWLYSSQALVPLSVRDGAVPNPPARLNEDEFSPAAPDGGRLGEVPQGGSWITIFTPDDPTTVSAPSGTTVDIAGEGRDKALRITPSAPDSAAVFDLGEGVLAQLAGRRVTFDVNAAAPEGESTQMSIRCNLAELGDCGRKRFDVEASRRDFLFEVELPDRQPGSFGSISLTPDISQGRVPVDIFGIRVFIPDS
ncbi:hypothetical protein ACLB6G_13955 [Zhengella sp. ZM62]|uniref:hypothetical protein n=1 Tax=Zhengella sedimenti TaxID=3390035 RepID=UPI003974A578